MRQARGGVLVVGGGFAGGYVARLLGERGATIVSPENFMLYTPMLPEAASGTLEPRHTVVPLRQMCPHAELVLGRVTAIDEAQQSVHVETTDAGTFDIGYDHLVLALGAVPRTFPVPGLAEHGVGFKDLAGRDQPPQPRPARARGRRRGDRPERRRPPPRLRLRRRRLCRRRGARGALRPRQGRAALVPAPARGAAALGARRRGAEDPPRDPAPPRRVRGQGAHRPRGRDPRLDHAGVVRRRRGRALERRADPDAHARLDGRSEGEPAARALRDTARRARSGPRRLLPPRRGTRAHLVARRLRRRPERADAGPVRPADLPARAPPGAPAGEEHRRRRRSRTATGCSARWRRSGATRESPT